MTPKRLLGRAHLPSAFHCTQYGEWSVYLLLKWSVHIKPLSWSLDCWSSKWPKLHSSTQAFRLWVFFSGIDTNFSMVTSWELVPLPREAYAFATRTLSNERHSLHLSCNVSLLLFVVHIMACWKRSLEVLFKTETFDGPPNPGTSLPDVWYSRHLLFKRFPFALITSIWTNTFQPFTRFHLLRFCSRYPASFNNVLPVSWFPSP